jgi:PHD/YefM family antitoxin component YafN of YafNO toxin-antitoxin module
VVIERRGRPVAALISYQTYQILQSLLIREELV